MWSHHISQLLYTLMRLGLIIVICCLLQAIFFDKKIPNYAAFFSLFFIVITFFVQYFVIRENFTIGYLISCLTFLITWHISAMYFVTIVLIPCFFVFLIFLGQISNYIYNDLKTTSVGPILKKWHNKLLWQMTLLRIYFGLNMVGHFTEKLFAGRESYYHLVKEFLQLGVTFHTDFIVLLAGLCELAIAIGIGLGVLTRLAAVCAALYFFIATILGHHFLNGFTWVNSGGGWEYPMLMIVFYISFILTGSGKFSIDAYLRGNRFVPRTLNPYWK